VCVFASLFFSSSVKGGRVTERGTHDELMKLGGDFVLCRFVFLYLGCTPITLVVPRYVISSFPFFYFR